MKVISVYSHKRSHSFQTQPNSSPKENKNSIRSTTTASLPVPVQNKNKVHRRTLRKSFFENSKISKDISQEEQIRILITSFPNFPTKMMTYLINKHSGNCRKVFDELISKGWESTVTKKYFSNLPTNQFSVAYYHGNFGNLNLEHLFEHELPGSFLTYYKYNNNELPVEYFLSFKSRTGEILEKSLKTFQLTKSAKKLLQLYDPILCEFKDISCIPNIQS